MEYLPLGRTQIEISRLCIGTWQVAGWEKADEGRFIETLHAAFDHGINFIDTAEAYGKGYAEQVVAKAVAGRRQSVVIATKVTHKNSHPTKVRKSIEQSLRNLKTDYIDLYQHHWPPKNIPLSETIGEFERLRTEGKIRAIGVSNWMEPEWEEFSEPQKIETLQPCYSLLWRSIEKTVLPLCREHKIAVLPYSPLCQGILAEKFEDLTQIPNDPRKQNRLLTPERFPQVLDFLKILRRIANEYKKTSAQTALRWLLQQDGVTAPVVGASSPQQLHENIGALGWTLDDAALNELSEASWPLSEKLEPYDTLWNWHPKK